MTASDIDDSVMRSFVPLAGDAHLTIVLGAGASAPSGLPTWDQFARRVAVKSGLVEDEPSARILLEHQDHSIVLEGARQRSGNDWAANLHDALYADGAQAPSPSPLHYAAAGHYLAAPRQTTLGTLNFDTLLEDALLSEATDEVIIGLDGTRDPDAPTVHHLHGVLTGREAIDTVVGYRDYAELMARGGPWQQSFLAEALERGPLLLAGTSYRDPDIRHFLHLIMRERPVRHPALVTIVREELELDRETFARVDNALAAEWEAIGLTALRMHDFTDVASVVRELQCAGQPWYEAPQARCRRIWHAHTSRFAELQEAYDHDLAAAGNVVSEALGYRTHRATLWLANAQGKLARWATDGVTYRGVRDLKTVPIGHDSAWISGEALGKEEVLLKDVARDQRVAPTWRSVLAIPLMVGDGAHPALAAGVLTFGLPVKAETLWRRRDEWSPVVERLSTTWGERVRETVFGVSD